MKNRRFFTAFLVLIGFFSVLVACSDDSSSDPPPSPAAKPSSSSTGAASSSSLAGGGNSSSLAGSGNSSSLAGSSSSLAGSSGSEEGESSSSLDGSSSSEEGESSSSQSSVASSSSSSEGTLSYKIPGAVAGAELVDYGTGVDANTILPANTQVTDVCFNVNFNNGLPARNIFMLTCRARTSPAKVLNVVVGHGGKCYKSDYPSTNTLNPIRIPIELDLQIASGANVVAQDVCIRFSEQITHSEAVLTCGIVNSTTIPPAQNGNMSAAATLVSCPWL